MVKNWWQEISRSWCRYWYTYHSDVFTLTDDELGETNLVTHHINMGDAKPVKALLQRLPYAVLKELEKELSKLIQIRCVELSSSPYASPLVLVQKKEGGLQVCVDYGSINQSTVLDCYPIPRIGEIWWDAISQRYFHRWT